MNAEQRETLRQEDMKRYKGIQSAVETVDELLSSVGLLDNITSEAELNDALPGLLASLGRYAMADRAYLFTWVSQEEQIFQMAHEWCEDGVRPTMEQMQSVRLSDMPNWAPRLNRGEAIVSMDWDAEREQTPEEFAVFDGQNIHSLIVIPIFTNKTLNGYVGFDNPAQSKYALSLRLLKAVGGHLGALKANLSMMAALEEKQKSLQSSLTELEEQRVALENALEKANLNSEIVGAISKLYWLIYRMDLVSGTYEEISAGQEMHELTGKRGSTAEVFKEVRETIVCAEHQELMARFLNTATLAERLRDTESVAMEYRAASGSWHLGRFIAKKRDEHGRVTNVLYVVRQIDKQKQQELEYKQKLIETAEEAKRANIAKTDFLRRMSHDIRTPINGIRGMISIANHYPEDVAKQQDCRNKVMQASGFLLDLVNSVLDMNKLESGVVTLEHKPFDLNNVLQETYNIIEMQAQEYAVPLHKTPWKIEHPYLLGSPLHLRQTLQNIAGNAVKYSREGGSVTLSCEEIAGENGKAVFRLICEDSGRGMSQAFLQRAFEPFAQEEPGARTAFTGTGLGLTITKQLVTLMGGEIAIESQLGVGTRVSVTLPFEIDTKHVQREECEEEAEEVSLEGVHVLLVEDNELNMEIARFLLERFGMTVTSAWNGQEAVDRFARSEDGEFDVILMDVMMPVLNGLDAARAIRAMRRSDARTVPIFAMTANAFPEDIQQSREAGMNEHLTKPLQEENLLRTIRWYMKNKSAV